MRLMTIRSGMNSNGLITPTPSTLFCLRFILACVSCFAILQVLPEAFFHPINRLNAVLAGRLLAGLGMRPEVQELVVVLGGFRAQVVGECSAVFISVLPVAFIFAYPSPWRQKIIGWLVGLALLFAVNLLRIAALVYAGAHSPKHFEMVHIYMGQPIMILVVLAICLLWLQWARHNHTEFRVNTILARGLTVSMLGFVFWLFLGEHYSRILYILLKALLGMFKISVLIPETMRIYPDTFQCLNFVSFSALFWGMGHGKVKSRMAQWLLGVFVLMVVHLLFKLLQVLFFQYRQVYLMGVINLLLVLNEWILPFGLWVLLDRRVLVRRR